MKAIDAILNRQTTKLLGDVERPLHLDSDRSFEINQIIHAAGNAPFHYAASTNHRKDEFLNGIEPWRVHTLHHDECRRLLTYLLKNKIDSGKIGQMLAVCRSLLIVNWCPDPSKTAQNELFEPSLRNMEHIAAAAAFTQNVITAATSAGFQTYWSSGGILREPLLFDFLKINRVQILLAAVFLFDSDKQIGEKHIGKLRPHRGQPDAWSRIVRL